MKKILLTSLTMILLLSACNQNKSGDTLALDTSFMGDKTVVAKVAGKDVYKSEFASYTKTRTQQDLDSMNVEVQKQIFNEFIQLDALSRKAVVMGLDKSADFGLQVHNLKKNLLAQALLSDFEKSNPISDADLQAEYDKAKSEFVVPQIKGRHILVKTEDEAKAIIVQLNKGADFAKLATEKSTGPSGPKGGDLGWFSPKQMVKPFADAIIALEDGNVSKTPVQTQFGFHVIKKEGERVGEAPPLENLRPRIEQTIKQQRVEKYLEEIRKELAVEELFTPQVKESAPAANTESPTETSDININEKDTTEDKAKK